MVDCDGGIITAGLVNTHHHLYQWLTRGRATSCDLFTWLQELYPVWARISAGDVEVAATVGLGELAMSGATTVADHHYVVPHGDDSVFDALASARGRSVSGSICPAARWISARAPVACHQMTVVERTDDILESTEAVAARLHDGDRVCVVVAPCSPFSVTTELMEQSAALARRLGLRMHTHLAETLAEEADCLARFGARPLDVVERLGWLAGDVWYAHGVHFNASEVARIGAAGAGVGHCPSSNARLASGFCPVRDLVDAGAPVGLGVDGVASSEGGDLMPEMKQALFLARLRSGRPDALTPKEALELATSGGARCLGRPELGRLEPGAPADIAVWPAEDIADIEDAVAGLVLGPSRRVAHLYVGGDAVVSAGSLRGLDLRAAHRELARRARRLWN